MHAGLPTQSQLKLHADGRFVDNWMNCIFTLFLVCLFTACLSDSTQVNLTLCQFDLFLYLTHTSRNRFDKFAELVKLSFTICRYLYLSANSCKYLIFQQKCVQKCCNNLPVLICQRMSSFYKCKSFYTCKQFYKSCKFKEENRSRNATAQNKKCCLMRLAKNINIH